MRKDYMSKNHTTCPNQAEHTDLPEGYLFRHEWANKKVQTHDQCQCPGCGLWAIWLPKLAKA